MQIKVKKWHAKKNKEKTNQKTTTETWKNLKKKKMNRKRKRKKKKKKKRRPRLRMLIYMQEKSERKNKRKKLTYRSFQTIAYKSVHRILKIRWLPQLVANSNHDLIWSLTVNLLHLAYFIR